MSSEILPARRPAEPGPTFYQRLVDNELDIAGLADLPDDEATLWRSLAIVRDWLDRAAILSNAEVAEVVFVVLRVAQEEYDEKRYWPKLEERLRHRPGWTLDEAKRNRLIEWFRRGLRLCNYDVPSQGLARLTPILMHAGIPKSSQPGLVRLVNAYQAAYRAELPDLEPEVIAQLADSFSGSVHVNVRRLLQNQWHGVQILWSALARVVLAQGNAEELEQELALLPAPFDPDRVREVLAQAAATEQLPQTSYFRPRLRYVPQTGEVRLWVPSGQPSDWEFSQSDSVKMAWVPDGDGWSAEAFAPLPAEVILRDRRDGVSHTLVARPQDWPGLWFRFGSGQMESGARIDAAGLEPGSWLVLIEGRPAPAPGEVLPLNWTFAPGGADWTAWQVEVPPRGPGGTLLRWHLHTAAGDRKAQVPLARRPGPRVEVAAGQRAVVLAQIEEDGRPVTVFAEAPHVILRRDRSTVVVLQRRTLAGARRVEEVELRPDQARSLPVPGAGVYQLREARGGRTLLDFAVLPGLRIDGPACDEDGCAATLRVAVDAGLGRLAAPTSAAGAPRVRLLAQGSWQVHASTVEPFLCLAWEWQDQESPRLTLTWPVPGLRWRLKGMTDAPAAWTRELIEVSLTQIGPEAQIEAQVPAGDALEINGEPAHLQPCAAGFHVLRPLTAYQAAGGVRLTYRDQHYPAMLCTDRPLLSAFDAVAGDGGVRVTWSPRPPEDTTLLAWNTLSPQAPAAALPLTDLEVGSAEVGWQHLPDGPYLSLALAQPSPFAGFGLAASYRIAADRNDPRQSLCRLVRRPGEDGSSDALRGWAQLAHDLQAALLSECPWTVNLLARLPNLEAQGQMPRDKVLQFAEKLDASTVLAAAKPEFRRCASAELLDFLRDERLLTRWLDLVPQAPDGDVLIRTEWLRAGVYLGWIKPFRLLSAPDDILRQLPWPLHYYRDLWLISCRPDEIRAPLLQAGMPVPEDLREQQKEAARRVVSFHKAWKLPELPKGLPARRRSFTLPVRHTSSLFTPPQFPFTVQGTLTSAADPEGQLGQELGLDYWHFQTRGSYPDGLHPAATHVLEWDAIHPGWSIDSTRLGFAPLRARPWSAEEWEEQLGLCAWLAAASPSPPPVSLPEFSDPGRVDAYLRALPAPAGPLHALVLQPTAGVDAVPEVMKLVWRLAWLDRLGADRGIERAFPRLGPLPLTRQEFLDLLAAALGRWPRRLYRCLALVEFLRLSLCEGGLGVAVKFDPA